MEDDAGTRDLGADVCIAKGTATAMQAHVRAALEKFRAGERRLAGVEGLLNGDETPASVMEKVRTTAAKVKAEA